MRELRDRVAVVTGGGSGIGEALVQACADAGMHVVVADVEGEAAERVARAASGRGVRALAVPADVSQRASMDALAERTFSELGGCHLLCNNAGVLVMGPLEDRSNADWDWVLGVNLRGVVHGLQAFVPRMREAAGGGHVVNTASVAGLLCLPELGVYTASKYAVVGLSETLRAELAPHGIGVSVLCPGGVETRIIESERNRPAALGGPRELSLPEAPDAGGAAAEEIVAPAVVARAVLDAVREDEFYVLTHPQYRALVARRFRELDDAFARAAKRQGDASGG